jgi:thiol-disulfide isomerase/thioredoxin
MKTRLSMVCAGCLAVLLLSLWPSQGFASEAPAAPPKEYQPAADEFSALGDSVLELLQSGATVSFAKSVSLSLEDAKSVLSTNLPPLTGDRLESFQRAGEIRRIQIMASAKAMLDRAATLHLDFTKGDWHPRVVLPKQFGARRHSDLQTENQALPWVEKLEIVLDAGSPATNSTNGVFKLVLRDMDKFPGGWRCSGGIAWEEFPSDVADEKTRREMAIWDKASGHHGLNGQDDPALLKLGEVLVRFILEHNTDVFQKEACVTADLIWGLRQRSARPGPPREELNEQVRVQVREQTDLARTALKQLDDAGVDLKNASAQIQEAVVESAQPQLADSLAGLIGRSFKLKLAVKSDARSANGTAVSGEYILAASQIMRFDDGWRVVNDLHWQQFPEGVVGHEVVEKMRLEDYVTEHRALPPGIAAPEIEFLTLDGERKMKLSDLKGKVVVIDFWATWCGPCQQPMADLQKLEAAHPDWRGKVAVMSLSIDDTLDVVRKHVAKLGWTNTFNAWAGDGGWQSKTAGAFRITAVPTDYIIDPEGKIVVSGHPAAMNIGEAVGSLLKPKARSE